MSGNRTKNMMQHEAESGSELDSDEELQEAFAKGWLKPGLNIVTQKTQKTCINDVVGLNDKLTSFSQLSLPWVERLDLVSIPAPEAPELAGKMEEVKSKASKQTLNEKFAKATTGDIVLHDFKREMLFYRQAQSAVLTGILRLKNMGIFTKRPDDYFAQMTKSDEHMQKVRVNLLKKQKDIEYREKVRHIRLMRKTNKQLQAQVRLQREREKRELMDKVKEFRKKKRSDLNFLDETGKPKFQGSKQAAASKRGETKTKYKNIKYGMGGKKRGSKRNTAESASEFGMPGKGKMKKPFGGKFPLKGNLKMSRPGKNKRMKQKSKR